MAGSTFIQVPQNVENPQQLKRFLGTLIQQLDVAFGNRGDNAFTTNNNFLSNVSSIRELTSAIQTEALNYSLLDGSRDFTGIVKYDGTKSFTSGSDQLVSVKYVEDGYTPINTTTNNPEQSAISDLSQTISDPPSQAEVQDISDKIDDILGALRASNIISI